MAEPDKLRVVSDGTPAGTYVTLGGKPIVNAVRLEIRVATDSLVTATLTVMDVELDLSVDRDCVAVTRTEDPRPRKEVTPHG